MMIGQHENHTFRRFDVVYKWNYCLDGKLHLLTLTALHFKLCIKLNASLHVTEQNKAVMH